MILITPKLNLDSFGLASLDVQGDSRRLTFCVSLIPGDKITTADGLAELASAFCSLCLAPRKIVVRIFEEPGDAMFSMRRSGAEFHLTITRFNWEFDSASSDAVARLRLHRKKDWGAARDSRNKRAVFRESCSFDDAVRHFHEAMMKLIHDGGEKTYQRAWGRPFPMAECKAMDDYLNRARD